MLRRLGHRAPQPGRTRLDGVVAWVSLAVAVLATSALLAAYDVGIVAQGRFVLVSALTVFLPGAILARWARVRQPAVFVDSLPGRFGAAFVLGLGPQLAGWAVAVASGVDRLVWLLPGLVVVAGGLVAFREGRWRPQLSGRPPSEVLDDDVPRPGLPWWGSLTLLLSWAGLLRSLVAGVWSTTPLSARGGWYQDMYWHVSITADALHHIPPSDPQSAADGALSYHWFSNASAAATVLAGGGDLDRVSILLSYLPVAAAGLALLYALALDLSRRHRAAAVAVVLLPLGPTLLPLRQLDAGGTSTLFWLSPSHLLAVPVGLLAVRLLVGILRAAADGRPPWRLLVVTLYVLMLCPGTKVSLLPVLLAGTGVAGVAMWWRSGRNRRAVAVPVLVAVCGAAILLVTLPVFGGGGGGSKLSYGATVGQLAMWNQGAGRGYLDPVVMSATILLVLCAYLPYLMVVRVARRGDPAGWFLAGAMIAGLGALIVLEHPSHSQLYFVRGIIAPAFAYLGWALDRAWGDRGRRGALAAAAGLAAAWWWTTTSTYRDVHQVTASWAVPAALTGVAAAFALVRVARRAGPATAAVVAGGVLGMALASGWSEVAARPVPALHVLGGHVTPDLSAEEVAAARALARVNTRGDLVATNVHCMGVVTTPHCDARGFWVSALSRSPVLVGGWAYASSARVMQGRGGLNYLHQPYGYPRVAAVEDRFFVHPDRAGADALRRLGVRYVYLDARASHVAVIPPALARTVHFAPGVQVYALH